MRFISRNTRPPERRPHGLTLDDVRGLIRKPVSYWAIDESGNPSRKPKENGKPFTLSAVTELSPIDYDRLLEGVPLYDGEVHFSKLRNEHPDICIRLITNLGYENILIVYKTVQKRSKKSIRTGKHIPLNELYLLSLLQEVIDAIMTIDRSDTVIVTYDHNESMREESCSLLWNDRCVLVMSESTAIRLVQIADLCASSAGRANLPIGYSESSYLEKLNGKYVDISGGLADCTQHSAFTHLKEQYPYDYKESGEKLLIKKRENGDRPQLNSAFLPYDDADSKYLTDSEPVKKGSRISKNAKIGRRTETRDIPQYRPARLQPDDRDSEYLTHSEAVGRRKEQVGSTQLPTSTPRSNRNGSGFSISDGRRIESKKRCIQCN